MQQTSERIKWNRGARDSADGRWTIGASRIRHGRSYETEFELYDRDASFKDRTRAVRSTAAECRDAAQQIVDRENSRKS